MCVKDEKKLDVLRAGNDFRFLLPWFSILTGCTRRSIGLVVTCGETSHCSQPTYVSKLHIPRLIILHCLRFVLKCCRPLWSNEKFARYLSL